MATNNTAGGSKAPTATNETIKDINTQVNDTVNSAIGAAKNGTKSNQPAAAAQTEPVKPQAAGNRSEAAQQTTQETESKIHKMNEKVKDFFRKLKPKKEGAATGEAGAPTTTESAAAQPGAAAK
jgi:ubiquitin